MEEYLQRLHQYLTQGGLTALDARDGMVAAYLVISRLNQLQGNPDVGLKQDEAALYQHFSGFLGAVFWERGYNYDHPTVPQLGEVKMMLDGTAQVFAMPENLQMALNEICDFLLARAGNQPAVVSSTVMDLLESHAPAKAPVSPAVENFDFSAPKNVPEPEAPAVFETVLEPVAEPAPEPEILEISTSVPAPPDISEPVKEVPEPRSPELEPDLVALFDEAMKPEPASETSPAPAAVPEEASPAYEIMESSAEPEVYPQEKAQPAWETSGPAETPVRPQFDLEPEKAATGLKAELPESSAAASGPVEPVKKKRGRKKAVETGEPKPKAVRKKAKVAKNRDASTIVVPDDYMQVSAPQAYPAAPLEGTAPDFSLESLGVKSDLSAESENLSWESLGSKPVIEEMAAPVADEMSFAAGADETAAAVSPGYGETAEQSSTISAWDTDSAVLDSEVQATPSSISELGTFPDLQTPAVEEPAPFQPRQNFEPVSTSEWSAPVAETVSTPPAYAAAVEQVPETEPAPAGGYDRGSARTQSELGYRPAFASAEPAAQSAGHQAGEEYGQEIMVKTVWGMPLTIGLVLGLIFGGAAAWMIANSQASGEEARSKESFAKQLMAAKTETDKIQTEANKMRDTLKAQAAAWRKTPDKPAHIKVGQGVLFYWSNEGMMRKYFVYRGKGPAGNMLKINPEPLDMNFLYLNRVEAGTWRFAVSAQTPEGVETDKGEPVVLSFPLAR